MSEFAEKSIGIIGTGKVATGFASAFRSAGKRVTILRDNKHNIAPALATLETIEWTDSAADLLLGNSIIILAIPDAALSRVDATLPWQPSHIAIHTSGALPSSTLAVAIQAGAKAACLHPPITIVSDQRAIEQFKSLPLIAEGDAGTVAVLERMTASFASHFITLSADEKRYHHLACMFSSNFFSVLHWRADQLWSKIGLAEDLRRELMVRFTQDYAENLAAGSLGTAVSGPLLRGDEQTIASHLQLLDGESEDLRQDFKRMCVRILELLLSSTATDNSHAEQWLLQLEQIIERY